MGEVSIVSFEEVERVARWDPEAFTPALRRLDIKFASQPRLRELATVTHPAEITRIYTEGKNSKPFLRAKNIRPFLPEVDDALRISKETYNALPNNRLLTNDVLVTRSGAYSGMACVYLGLDGKAYTSSEGLIVRSLGNIDGAYLSAFLNTEIGMMLCRRAIYGSGQPHVLPRYLELIPIPRLGSVEDRAAALVRDAFSLLQAASSYYPEAEAEMLKRLGWNKLVSTPLELGYIADFDKLESAGRFDPEYYHPRYARLRVQINKRGGMSLGQLVTSFGKGTQPESYDENGEIIVLKSKNVYGRGINWESCDRTALSAWGDVPARLSERNVVINMTGRGTLGRAEAITVLPHKAVAAVDLAICHLDESQVNPIYLALFLNSPAGLAQSEQFQTGSSGQLHLYPQHLQQFQVFIPRKANGEIDLPWQHFLADKVLEASRAKERASKKLQDAIRLVEKALH